MTTLDRKSIADAYKRAAEDRYWKIVREVLKDIFNADPALVDQYCRELLEANPDEQILVYHSEPIDVAADLADIRITREHVDMYRKMIYDLPPNRHMDE